MKLLSKKDIVPLVIILFVVGCVNSAKESMITNLMDYQNGLDKKIERVTQEGNLYEDSLKTLSKTSNDTFELAKELIYLKNAKFLLESQYDSVGITINQLKENTIDIEKAKTIFEGFKGDLNVLQSKYKID